MMALRMPFSDWSTIFCSPVASAILFLFLSFVSPSIVPSMIRRSFKRPNNRDDGGDARHDRRISSDSDTQPSGLPLPDSNRLRFAGYREKSKPSGTENNNQRYFSANTMENQTQDDPDDLADALGLSHQQELHRTRRGWTHQRTANKEVDSKDDKLHEGFVDGEMLHDDHREYRTTKRLMLRLALALVGTYVTCFAVEKVLHISGPASALTNLNFHAATEKGYAWRGAITECTGPEDGYVYGGDPGKVLSFVHHREGSRRVYPDEEGVEDDRGGDYPALADLVRWVWTLKRDWGVLAFKVGELESRRVKSEGTGWECILTANFGRSKPFPKPGPAEVAWDPEAFNFYKASPHEFVLSYTPSFRRRDERTSATEVTESGAIGLRGVALRGGAAGGNDAQDADPRTGLNSAAAAVSSSPISCEVVSTESPPQDALLVNIKPVGLVSLLLTPGYPNSNHQRATAYALAVAMDFAEALRSDPGLRLGFNSGGSSASVNHNHFQCWYFDASETGGLPIETASTQFVRSLPLNVDVLGRSEGEGVEASRDVVNVFTLQGYPLRGLVFHTLGKDLEAVSEVIESCVNYLIGVNTPHTMLFSTDRVFLLPRKRLEEPPFAVVPGFPEVSGEIIVTSEDDFERLAADDIYRWWHEKISVDPEDFDRIVNACLTF